MQDINARYDKSFKDHRRNFSEINYHVPVTMLTLTFVMRKS